MTRRRSLPWIHRFSRPIMGGIAVIGALLTAYLTIAKLTGGEVVCSAGSGEVASGCSNVLDSPYATVLGLPLPLFGLLAYLGMATFALSPLIIDADKSKSFRKELEKWTWLLLLVGATAMATFSGFLMYVLFFKLQALCLYCISSALFSLSFLVLTIIGREWEDVGQIFFNGLIVAVITIIAALGIYSPLLNPVADGGVIPQPTSAPEPPLGWEITTTSGEAEMALASYLTSIGAKKYGAFWCPHCYDQKQLFGKQAFSEVDYIECAQEGKNPQPQVCINAGVQSYPTWEIKGEQYSGTQTLERLADLSGYTGATNFKYRLPGR